MVVYILASPSEGIACHAALIGVYFGKKRSDILRYTGLSNISATIRERAAVY